MTMNGALNKRQAATAINTISHICNTKGQLVVAAVPEHGSVLRMQVPVLHQLH